MDPIILKSRFLGTLLISSLSNIEFALLEYWLGTLQNFFIITPKIPASGILWASHCGQNSRLNLHVPRALFSSQITSLGEILSYSVHWVVVTRNYLQHTSEISQICFSQHYVILLMSEILRNLKKMLLSKAAFAAPQLQWQVSVDWCIWSHTALEKNPQQMQIIPPSVIAMKHCLFRKGAQLVHSIK